MHICLSVKLLELSQAFSLWYPIFVFSQRGACSCWNILDHVCVYVLGFGAHTSPQSLLRGEMQDARWYVYLVCMCCMNLMYSDWYLYVFNESSCTETATKSTKHPPLGRHPACPNSVQPWLLGQDRRPTTLFRHKRLQTRFCLRAAHTSGDPTITKAFYFKK